MTPTVHLADDGALVVMPAVAARSGKGTGVDAGEGGPVTLCLVLNRALVEHYSRRQVAS